MLRVLHEKKAAAKEQMQRDGELLHLLEETSDPILRFYAFSQRCATYGAYKKPDSYINTSLLSDFSIEIAERVTGGGLLFHITDCLFSFFLPSKAPLYSQNVKENYRLINSTVQTAIKDAFCLDTTLFDGAMEPKASLFCHASAALCDVMIGEKKLCGGALRKTKFGFVHQASLLIEAQPIDLFKTVLKDPSYAEMMEKKSISLKEVLGGEAETLKQQLKASLTLAFMQRF